MYITLTKKLNNLSWGSLCSSLLCLKGVAFSPLLYLRTKTRESRARRAAPRRAGLCTPLASVVTRHCHAVNRIFAAPRRCVRNTADARPWWHYIPVKRFGWEENIYRQHILACTFSKFWKQIFLFSFEPKNEQNYFLNSVLASKMSQIKKMRVLYID